MIAARFGSRPDLVEFLGKQLVKGRLALFLGAGITMQLAEAEDGNWMGLPSWPKLIGNLYATEEAIPPQLSDLVNAADEFRLKYCYENYQKFAERVTQALYKDINLEFAAIRRNDTLGALGALAISSLRGSVSEIVTFNFDDILERYLIYHGLVATPVFEEKFWVSRGDVLIYHPNGFLPSPGSCFGMPSDYLVLDRSSYSKTTGRSDQRMNQKMETIMQSNVCLFVGLSGDDQRLDSLLMVSKDKHAYNSSQMGYWGVTLSTSDRIETARRWAERGVYHFRVTDYENDLPTFLFQISQSAGNCNRISGSQ